MGGFPPPILSQIKNPWFVQGKHMNQNKLCLAQEEKDFLISGCQMKWIDHAS